MNTPTAHQRVGDATPALGRPMRSVSASLAERPDGNPGTRLTVRWTDQYQPCTTKYHVGQYITASSEWMSVPGGTDLPTTTGSITYDHGSELPSLQVPVVCAANFTPGVISDPAAALFIGEDTAILPPPPPVMRSVSATLTDRTDGMTGTRLTVRWTEGNSPCTTKYHLLQDIVNLGWVVLLDNANLPTTTKSITYDYST